MARVAVYVAFSACLAAVPRVALAGPLDDLQPGEWYEVPSSHMEDVAGPNPGTGNVSCVMSCWAGGAFDPKRDRLYVTGGGHQGYAGNEIYAFDVNDLIWHRLDDPSPIASIDGTGTECPDPSLAPCSTHTYDGLEYVPPPVDRLIVAGCCLPSAYEYNLDAATWALRALPPNLGNTIGNFSATDPVSGLFFFHATYGRPLVAYDGTRGTWTDYGSDSWFGYYFTAAIDPVRRKLVAVGQSDPNALDLVGKVLVWDISDPNAPKIGVQPAATTGDQAPMSSNSPGFDYDPVSDKLVAWLGGSDVYALDMDAMSWEKRAATNAVMPTAPNGNGTFGRFRYVPSKNVFILVNQTNENVFFYKLARGGGTPFDGGTMGVGGSSATGAGAAPGSGAGVGGVDGSVGAGSAEAPSPASDQGDCACRLVGGRRVAARNGHRFFLGLFAIVAGFALRRRARPRALTSSRHRRVARANRSA